MSFAKVKRIFFSQHVIASPMQRLTRCGFSWFLLCQIIRENLVYRAALFSLPKVLDVPYILILLVGMVSFIGDIKMALQHEVLFAAVYLSNILRLLKWQVESAKLLLPYLEYFWTLSVASKFFWFITFSLYLTGKLMVNPFIFCLFNHILFCKFTRICSVYHVLSLIWQCEERIFL